MNHKDGYAFICIIQSADILLNFVKLNGNLKKPNLNPMTIFKAYITGNFITDVIAVIPYSVIKPELIFLRYLKLMKFDTYFMYIEDVFTEYLLLVING